MEMQPNVWFKILFIALGLFLSFCSGCYVYHLKLVAYQEKVEAQGKIQEQHNKDLLVQQQLITKQVFNDYENKLARIKSYYGGLHYPSSGQLSNSSQASPRIDGTPTDPQFALKCAETTQQLESLQDFVNQQLGLK